MTTQIVRGGGGAGGGEPASAPHAPHAPVAERRRARADMTDKTFTREQIARLKGSKEQIMFVIDNLVYDVTSFQDEHPGGHEVLFNEIGGDGSESFHDVGHSADAKDLMRKYVVGELVEADRVETKKRHVAWEDNKGETEQSDFLTSWKFPVLLGVLVTLLYTYLWG